MRIAILETTFEPGAELAFFEAANRDSGAIATFTGRCRPQSRAGAVRSLELQHYPSFTEREIERFVAMTKDRLDLSDVLILHRVGSILPGEAIVLVAVASPHRSEAFKGVETIIDFLKTDAPLWKREVSETGATWVEPTVQDYRRRQEDGGKP